MFQRFLKPLALSAILLGIFVLAASAANNRVNMNQPDLAPTTASDVF